MTRPAIFYLTLLALDVAFWWGVVAGVRATA